MGFLYSPLLLITAWLETKQAHSVKRNRRHGESDEDTTEEWEQIATEMDFESEGWAKKVEGTKPNVETDAAVLEIREVLQKIEALTREVEALRKQGGDSGVGDGKGER